MKANVTRGSGLLENFLAKQRIKIANKLIPEIKRKGKILDVGCGTTPLFLLNTNFEERYGIDYSIKGDYPYLKLHKRNLTQEKLPFKDNFFDVVTMLAVFEHVEPKNLIQLIKEIKRILKPKGRFILTTPCQWSDWILKTMAKLNLVSSEEINDHKDTYSHKKIKKILIKSGFEKNKMNMGYFEIFLNNWVYVDK